MAPRKTVAGGEGRGKDENTALRCWWTNKNNWEGGTSVKHLLPHLEGEGAEGRGRANPSSWDLPEPRSAGQGSGTRGKLLVYVGRSG